MTEPADPARAALVRCLARAARGLRRYDVWAAGRAAPRPPLTRATLAELCRALAADLARPDAAAGGGSTLTPREREVAALVAAGLRDRLVAAVLGIAVRTAEKHGERIRAKLGLPSRYGLAAWAPSGARRAA